MYKIWRIVICPGITYLGTKTYIKSLYHATIWHSILQTIVWDTAKLKHQEKRQLNKALKPVFKGYTDKFLTSKQKYHVTLKK